MRMLTWSRMSSPLPGTSGVCRREGLVKGHGGLARQTDHGQAVRAVRRDLKLDHVVVRADDGGDVVAGLHAVLLHDPQAVLDGVGVVMQRQAELLERAHHAVGEPRRAACRRGSPCRRAGAQPSSATGTMSPTFWFCAPVTICIGSLAADVDLADPHVVGVRVAHHLHDAARDNVSECSRAGP